ncbi:Cell death protease [Ascosphaera acerosa]|nr:Cell death protease [Ascosphaera acerosa]
MARLAASYHGLLAISVLAIIALLAPPAYAEEQAPTTAAKSAADYYVSSLPGQPEGSGPKMHAGHIEIDHETNGNLFFWHFESKHRAGKARTILWLNGGPGCSSLDGALMEIGPYRLNDDQTLRQLPTAWNDFANVLFVDQPVGTGFSYANTNSYDHEMGQIAEHMVTFLEKWFAVFPQYETDDLYIAGESFAGQHIPYIAKAIIERNRKADPGSAPWSLQGLLIGNGWIAPREQYEAYTKFAYARGLLEPGTDAAKAVDKQRGKCRGLYANDPETSQMIDVPECEAVLNTILDRTEHDGKCINLYDVRKTEPYPQCGTNWPPDLKVLTPYLRRDDVIEALHINPDKKTGWEECSGAVGRQLKNKNSKPAVDLLPDIIESGVPVLLFSGEDDLICNHVGTEDLIASMEWQGATGFGNAPRFDWQFGGEKIGFYQEARNLTYALFHNASHMVPYDHPDRTVDMVNRFMRVDVAALLDSPAGTVLDGSGTANRSRPVDNDIDRARERKLHQEELRQLLLQGEQQLRAAVYDAYKKSVIVCILALLVLLVGFGLIALHRRRWTRSYPAGNILPLHGDRGGAYGRVGEAEDSEETIGLMRMSKKPAASSSDDVSTAYSDDSRLPSSRAG